MGNAVPKYLRYKGKVVNRNLTRANCVKLIRDVWIAKKLYDESPKNKGKQSKVIQTEHFQYVLSSHQPTTFLIDSFLVG